VRESLKFMLLFVQHSARQFQWGVYTRLRSIHLSSYLWGAFKQPTKRPMAKSEVIAKTDSVKEYSNIYPATFKSMAIAFCVLSSTYFLANGLRHTNL